MAKITQYINDHKSAIMATVIFLQNFTPFGRELKALMWTIGAVLQSAS